MSDDLVDDRPTDRHRLAAVLVALFALLAAGVPLALWWTASQSSASFADAEVLEVNHLGAGTLDIDVGSDQAALEATNLVPGEVVSGQLEVTNAGSLPLLYAVTARTGGGVLADWLLFELWLTDDLCRPGGPEARITTDVMLVPGSTPLAPLGEPGLALTPGATALVCLGATLPLDAPNEVQGKRLDVELVIDAVHDIEATEADS